MTVFRLHPSRSSSLRAQQGGTLLGVIIGLVIGLAVAVVLALYITNSQSPFTSKQMKTVPVPAPQAVPAPANDKAATPPAAPTAESIADPNAPLYSKVPIKPATTQGTAQDKDNTVNSAVPAQKAAEAERKPETKKEDGKPADPIGDIARKAGSSDDGSTYLLQVGAYKTPEDAERQRAKLALQGIETRISERETADAKFYRVRVGPFGKLDDVNRMKERLQQMGIEPSVIRIARQN